MNDETRRLALRAAAAVVGVSACSSPPAPPNAATVEVKPATAAPIDSSLPSTQARDCTAITDQEFGATDDYNPQPPPKASTAARECCRAVLVKGYDDEPNSVFYKHRWACCAVVPDAVVGSACTPWGPPVPPRMARRRAISKSPAAA